MEERIIDDEYGRGIRFRKTKDGYVDATDELAEEEKEFAEEKEVAEETGDGTQIEAAPDEDVTEEALVVDNLEESLEDLEEEDERGEEAHRRMPGLEGERRIRATTLDVQRQAKIRPALRIGLAVLCRRSPIPDSQLSIGQSFLPHPGNDRVFAPLSGVAALAGHVRGISVRRHRPDRHRFLRRRGLGRCLRRVSAAA